MLKKYTLRPRINYCSGVIYYISNKSCNIITKYFSKINYDIFYLDKLTKSYPFTIEDVGIGFILFMNNIKCTTSTIFFDNKNSICRHTNFNR